MALTFDYKVRDRSGSLVEGQLDGDSMALVVRRLREMGYMPVSVTPKSGVNVRKEITIPGLTSGIIKGFSDQFHLKGGMADYYLGMASADSQTEKWK